MASLQLLDAVVITDSKNRVKTLKDVREIYLANCLLQSQQLVEINLSRFPFLCYLWLQDNDIHEVTFLKQCPNLKELYLHQNSIISIRDCMRHLHSMEVLYLQNNKLQHLQETLKELLYMHSIRILNMSLNPLTQEKQYRLLTVASLSSTLMTLDQHNIDVDDRTQANLLRRPNREHIDHNIAFGHSYHPIKSLHIPKPSPSKSRNPPRRSKSARHHRKVTYGRDADIPKREFESPKQLTVDTVAADITKKKSFFQFAIFDWSKIPRHRECIGDKMYQRALDEMKPELRTVTMQM